MARFTIVIEEGLGSYDGTPNVCSNLHPNGRLGARLTLFDNEGNQLYQTLNASTLPDGISDAFSQFTSNSNGVCIIKEGCYPSYTHRHSGKTSEKYHALQLEKLSNNSKVEAVRHMVDSYGTGINLHYRNKNDDWRSYPTYAFSTGCQTVLEDDIYGLWDAMGLVDSDFDTSEYIADVVIKRECLPEEVKEYLIEQCGDLAYDLFTEVEEVTADEIMVEAFDEPEGWLAQLDRLEQFGETFESEYLCKYIRNAFEKVYELGKNS